MSNAQKAIWALRIGIAGEFLGHGLLAIGGKADWVKWITVITHVSQSTAVTLLLLVGIFDVIVAAVILFKPIKPAILWAIFWGFFTALIRPIVMYMGVTGVGWLDFVERFANFGAPLALYFLMKRD